MTSRYEAAIRERSGARDGEQKALDVPVCAEEDEGVTEEAVDALGIVIEVGEGDGGWIGG